MKILLFIAVFVAFFSLLFIGCDLFLIEETFNYKSGGLCVEVTTTDNDVKDAAKLAGYKPGSCPTTGIIGTCEDYTELEGTSFDAVFYDEVTVQEAEDTCTAIDGTWDPK